MLESMVRADGGAWYPADALSLGAPVLGAIVGAVVAGPRHRWAGVGVGILAGYLVGSYYTASSGVDRARRAADDADELLRLSGG